MITLTQQLWNIKSLQIALSCSSEDNFKFACYNGSNKHSINFSSYLSFSNKKKNKLSTCSFSVPHLYKLKSSLSSFCVDLKKINNLLEDEMIKNEDIKEMFVVKKRQILGCGSNSINLISYFDDECHGLDAIKIRLSFNEDEESTIIISCDILFAIENITSTFDLHLQSMLLINTFKKNETPFKQREVDEVLC